MTRPCPCDDAGIFLSVHFPSPRPVRTGACISQSGSPPSIYGWQTATRPLKSRSRAQMLNLDKELSRHAGDIHVRYSSHGLSNK